MVNGVYITQGRPANQLECKVTKTHKEIVRIMVFSLPCQKDGQATSNTKARAPLPDFSRVIWDEWGKKGVRMDTKALKKQMGAAIAMVLVAAVALGSATFAWFVSNNTVKAETATISAQSNAPFLKIAKTDEELENTSISFAVADAKVLYPSQVVNGKADSLVTETTKPLFQSAYAQKKGEATILNGSRYDVGAPEAAVTGEFAIAETFKIGTNDAKAGSFKNLKVSKVEVTGAGKDEADGLKDAISVLLVCNDNWAVYKVSKDGTLVQAYADNTAVTGNGNGILAETIAKNASVNVTAYVFYDGSAAKVYTENLTNLAKGVGVNITFTATPVNTQGTEVNAGNDANAA